MFFNYTLTLSQIYIYVHVVETENHSKYRNTCTRLVISDLLKVSLALTACFYTEETSKILSIKILPSAKNVN